MKELGIDDVVNINYTNKKNYCNKYKYLVETEKNLVIKENEEEDFFEYKLKFSGDSSGYITAEIVNDKKKEFLFYMRQFLLVARKTNRNKTESAKVIKIDKEKNIVTIYFKDLDKTMNDDTYLIKEKESTESLDRIIDGLEKLKMENLNLFDKNILELIIGSETKEEKAREVKMTSPLFDEDDNDDKVHIRVSVLRNIAAAAIAIFAFFMISTPLNNGSRKEMSMLNMNTETLTRILPKTTVQGVAEVKGITAKELNKKEEKAIQKSEVENLETSSSSVSENQEVKPEEQNLPYYTIVLASHVSKKNAAAYVEKLHKAGFNEAQVYSGRSTTRVIFNQYKSEAEAYGALHEMREYTEFNDAWVYKVEG